VLHRLDDAGLIDVTRVVLDTAHVRAKKGANTQVRALLSPYSLKCSARYG
jgi:hypothetical protein